MSSIATQQIFCIKFIPKEFFAQFYISNCILKNGFSIFHLIFNVTNLKYSAFMIAVKREVIRCSNGKYCNFV